MTYQQKINQIAKAAKAEKATTPEFLESLRIKIDAAESKMHTYRYYERRAREAVAGRE